MGTLAAGEASSVCAAASRGIAVASSLLGVGTVWHLTSYANTDIAWLLTVGEQVLDGAVPYRDIIETNPPGSVLLYMPAVLVGRLTGLDPQGIVMVLAGLAGAACLAWCATILRPVLPARMRGFLLGIGAAVLVLLPAGSFGQREHVILMVMLPMLCGLAARQDPGPLPSPWPAVLAGVAAGIGLAVKPYYVLGLVGPALLMARRAGWRALLGAPELWSAAMTAALLLGLQLLLFPAFTHSVLPLLGRVYLPMRLPLSTLLLAPGGTAALAALVAGALVQRAHGSCAAVSALRDTAALAALGFFVAYLVQGKGWAYHAYPAIAAGLLVIGIPLAGAAANDMRSWACRGSAVLLAGCAMIGFDRHMDIDSEAPGLVAAVSATAPHPRVMSLAPDLAVGHPLVRRVGGRWVGTLMASWIDLYVEIVTGRRDPHGPLGADLAFEDRILASDIRDRHPDAVLAWAPTWQRWIAGEPQVAAALADYRSAGTYGSVTLWVPKR